MTGTVAGENSTTHSFRIDPFTKKLTVEVDEAAVKLNEDVTVELFHYLRKTLPEEKIWSSK